MAKKTRYIPDKVALEVWVAAGGRCCICNKYLFRNNFTAQEGKFGEMAHMVAFGDNGPRPVSELTDDDVVDLNRPANLMLLCRDEHRLIDKDQVEFFTLERLRQCKAEHEARIHEMTSAFGSYRCRVVAFTANVADQKTVVSDANIYNALWPNFPSSSPHRIDDNKSDVQPGPGYWQTKADEIHGAMAEALRVSSDRDKYDAVAVFAIGPIPMLFKIGRCLSDKVTTLLFQRHRDTSDWTWKDGEGHAFSGQLQGNPEGTDTINLFLSISGDVDSNAVPEDVRGLPTYTIRPKDVEPSRTLVETKETLENYAKSYNEFLDLVSTKLNHVNQINVIPAVPIPIALFSGQQRIKSDPSLRIYDIRNDQFEFTLELKND